MAETNETPANFTIRRGIEATIVDLNNAGDMNQVNHWLDRYPYNQTRKDLAVAAFYRTLKRKGKPSARFFEKQAIEEASQPTEEIPIVAQETLDAA